MINSDKKKKFIIFLITATVLTAVILCVFIVINVAHRNYVKSTYASAESLIDSDSFEKAKALLEKIEDDEYKDTYSLIKLCEAHIAYDSGMREISSYFTYTKFNYQSEEQLQKITDFRYKARAEYDKFYKELFADIRTENNTSSNSSYNSDSSVTSSKKTYSYKPKSSSSKSVDPYNAKDFATEEDFYDEYYDEFYDYYDAEDYYNEHCDD